ncbi:YgaP family membrane protein [Geminocystis herdmanii]|uniref:YgaP family membrane protein n=1 Tax=Geminocystis herdmanii TaxID=669359 RepID=UPI00034B3371|nr:DUF2892 domain-containing protein [Geminocystis herdmanii]
MFNNVGTVDRIIRFIFASVCAYLGLFTYSGSSLGIGLTIGAGLLTFSALASTCLMYGLLGISTKKPLQN